MTRCREILGKKERKSGKDDKSIEKWKNLEISKLDFKNGTRKRLTFARHDLFIA